MAHTIIFYEKRDDFNFAIVTFPFLCSNIPFAPLIVCPADTLEHVLRMRTFQSEANYYHKIDVAGL
jgi:hypothetical protein